MIILEVGKFYKTTEGFKVSITGDIPRTHFRHPVYQGHVKGQKGKRSWLRNGEYIVNKTKYNIVSEWNEEFDY